MAVPDAKRCRAYYVTDNIYTIDTAKMIREMPPLDLFSEQARDIAANLDADFLAHQHHEETHMDITLDEAASITAALHKFAEAGALEPYKFRLMAHGAEISIDLVPDNPVRIVLLVAHPRHEDGPVVYEGRVHSTGHACRHESTDAYDAAAGAFRKYFAEIHDKSAKLDETVEAAQNLFENL